MWEDLSAPALQAAAQEAEVLVDGVFGFGFAGSGPAPLRAPFDRVLLWMAGLHGRAGACSKLVSIDVPSGWDDAGAVEGEEGAPHRLLHPDMVISLSAPKTCMRAYAGVHYLGGRFIPPGMEARHALALPPYPGSAQCLRLSGPSK